MAPNLTAHCESALPCTWVFGVRGQEACRMLTPLPPLQVSHRRRRGFCFLEQPKSHQRAQQRRAALDLHQAALRPADRAPPGLLQKTPWCPVRYFGELTRPGFIAQACRRHFVIAAAPGAFSGFLSANTQFPCSCKTFLYLKLFCTTFLLCLYQCIALR